MTKQLFLLSCVITSGSFFFQICVTFSEKLDSKSDSNQSSFLGSLVTKYVDLTKNMHGNLDGREMKQAVTQRTSQLPLLLVAGNSMAEEDFFASTSEASVKPAPVSLPACPFRLTRPRRTTMARVRRVARRQAKAGGSQAKAGLNCRRFWVQLECIAPP